MFKHPVYNGIFNSLFFIDFKQYPTKALAPLMLEDYRKVMVDRRGEEEQFTADHIAECMKKGNEER